MKLGTWWSQSGSPFLNLILQNWKTCSYLKFMEKSPSCAWYMVCTGLALRLWGDRMKSGIPRFLARFPFRSPWVTEMVSNAALNEWGLASGRRPRAVINSHQKKKKTSSLLPICQLGPRRLWRRQAALIFTPISGTSQKAGQITRPTLFPCTLAQRKRTLKHSWKKRNYNKPIFHSPNVFLPLGQALGFHWQGVRECLHAPGHLVEELDIFLSMKSSSVQIYDLIKAWSPPKGIGCGLVTALTYHLRAWYFLMGKKVGCHLWCPYIHYPGCEKRTSL